MYLDWYDISETKWGSSDTGGEAEVVTCTLRAAGESDGQVELAADVWGAYGLSYRPASPKAGAVCQAITYTAGGKRHVIATRDTRGGDCHGALNDGDVALWSVGKNSVRCNADGSIAIHQIGSEVDAGISVEKDGTILIFNEFGQIELGKNGFQVFTKDGGAIALGNGSFQTISKTAAWLRSGSVLLGPSPTKPLTTGSGAAVPIPYILGLRPSRSPGRGKL